MKKVVLTVLTMLMLIIPAYAASENGEPITTANTYKVYHFAGLQNALDKANNGDTIELQNPITISESIIIGSSNKHITVKLNNQYYDTSRAIISISNFNDSIKIELRNITFDCQNIQSGPILSAFVSELLIDNCVFKNIKTDSDLCFLGRISRMKKL